MASKRVTLAAVPRPACGSNVERFALGACRYRVVALDEYAQSALLPHDEALTQR